MKDYKVRSLNIVFFSKFKGRDRNDYKEDKELVYEDSLKILNEFLTTTSIGNSIKPLVEDTSIELLSLTKVGFNITDKEYYYEIMLSN